MFFSQLSKFCMNICLQFYSNMATPAQAGERPSSSKKSLTTREHFYINTVLMVLTLAGF